MTAHHQNVSGSKKDYWAQWVPCVATFCHITSAILNVFNWDFSNPTFFQSTFYCKYSFFFGKSACFCGHVYSTYKLTLLTVNVT